MIELIEPNLKSDVGVLITKYEPWPGYCEANSGSIRLYLTAREKVNTTRTSTKDAHTATFSDCVHLGSVGIPCQDLEDLVSSVKARTSLHCALMKPIQTISSCYSKFRQRHPWTRQGQGRGYDILGIGVWELPKCYHTNWCEELQEGLQIQQQRGNREDTDSLNDCLLLALNNKAYKSRTFDYSVTLGELYSEPWAPTSSPSLAAANG